MTASKAHVLFIQKQFELNPDKQPRELQRLSDTCKYASLDSICNTFDAILSTRELIGDGSDKLKAIEAVGLYHHIQFSISRLPYHFHMYHAWVSLNYYLINFRVKT